MFRFHHKEKKKPADAIASAGFECWFGEAGELAIPAPVS